MARRIKRKAYPIGKGNAGLHEGKVKLRYLDEIGRPQQDEFHKIKAVPGTWLSAACRRYGWGAIYGKKDGYGAYVEGVVRKEDGSFYQDAPGPMKQDSIEPGQRFYIQIYHDRTGGRRSRPVDRDELPPKHQDRVKVDEPTMDFATKVGLGLDVTVAILDGVGLAPLGHIMIPFQMATAGQEQWPLFAGLRAECYAVTAFNVQQYEGSDLPLSSMFRGQPKGKKYITRSGDGKSPFLDWLIGRELTLEEIWRYSWANTTTRIGVQFKKTLDELNQDISEEGGTPVQALWLRRYIMKRCLKDYKNATNHCDAVMERAGKTWTGKFAASVRPLWERYRKRVKYPQ
jgi:hypothetical protein